MRTSNSNVFNGSGLYPLLGVCGLIAAASSRDVAHFAKIALSPLINDIRKKAGTGVYQAGRMGNIVRRHSIPRQPRTAVQRVVRGNFGTNSQGWGTVLSQAERDAWTAFAATLFITDRLGRKFVPTGIQLYQRVSRNLHTITLGPLTTPPANQIVSSPLAVTVVSSLVGATVTVDVSSDPAANEVPVVFAAPLLSPGVNTPGKKLRYLFQAAAATAGPYACHAAFLAMFGEVVVGKKLFVGVEYINNVTGARSGLVTGSTIVIT